MVARGAWTMHPAAKAVVTLRMPMLAILVGLSMVPDARGATGARAERSCSGVVVDRSGNPAASVRVEIVDADDFAIGTVAQSDARGGFTLTGVPAGTWFVRASSEGSIARSRIGSASVRLEMRAHGELDNGVQSEPQGATTVHPISLEDFEDGSIADYTVLGAVVSSVEAAAGHDGFLGLALAEQTFPGWIYRSGVLTSQKHQYSAWVKPGSDGRAYVGIGSNATGTFALAAGVNTQTIALQYVHYNNPHETFAETPFIWTAGKWYRVIANWNAGGAISCTVFDSDGFTPLATVSGSSATFGGVAQGGNAWRGFGDTHRFDSLVETTVLPGAGPLARMAIMLLLGGMGAAALRSRRAFRVR